MFHKKKDDNNTVEIKSKKIAKLNLNIEGTDNKVIIEEDVIVKETLNITINGHRIFVHIKKGCTFENTDISVIEDDNYVIIGEDCMFALGTIILASDFHSIIDNQTGRRMNIKKGVELGNHIWVGIRAMILKNTMIADNTVIAAGATVSGKFLSNCIIGGVPARVIKNDINWCRQLLENHDIKIPNQIKEAPIEFNIEKQLTSTNQQLTGWAVLKDVTTIHSEILFQVTDDQNETHDYIAYKNASQDVSDYYQNPNFIHSRFMSNIGIPLKKIKKIECCIVENNVGYKTTIYQLNNNDRSRK